MTTSSNYRQADYPIEPSFLNRWSPRAFTAETISETELLTILEAGRWAPSAYNEFNQGWAKSASALVLFISKSHFTAPGAAEASLSYSHSFDTGAAWGAIAHQAQLLGLQAHGMTGLHFDKAIEILGIPDGYRVEAAAAIGRPGDKAQLPDYLQARETPSPRRPLAEIAFNGTFVAE
jgi:nitroreductase